MVCPKYYDQLMNGHIFFTFISQTVCMIDPTPLLEVMDQYTGSYDSSFRTDEIAPSCAHLILDAVGRPFFSASMLALGAVVVRCLVMVQATST